MSRTVVIGARERYATTWMVEIPDEMTIAEARRLGLFGLLRLSPGAEQVYAEPIGGHIVSIRLGRSDASVTPDPPSPWFGPSEPGEKR